MYVRLVCDESKMNERVNAPVARRKGPSFSYPDREGREKGRMGRIGREAKSLQTRRYRRRETSLRSLTRTDFRGRRDALGPRRRIGDATRRRDGSRVAKVSKFRRGAPRARHIRAHADAKSRWFTTVNRPLSVPLASSSLLAPIVTPVFIPLSLFSPKMYVHLLLPHRIYARITALTGCTNATPRHSRQLPITATVSART